MSTHNSDAEFIRNSLRDLGELTEVYELACAGEARVRSFRVKISADDPTLVFDACAELGRIKSVKVQERS